MEHNRRHDAEGKNLRRAGDGEHDAQAADFIHAMQRREKAAVGGHGDNRPRQPRLQQDFQVRFLLRAEDQCADAEADRICRQQQFGLRQKRKIRRVVFVGLHETQLRQAADKQRYNAPHQTLVIPLAVDFARILSAFGRQEDG